MKLPWRRKIEEKEHRLEELRERLEKLSEEHDSLRERFEAEKERRSRLARQKQEAEEELNRLKDRLEVLEQEEEEESVEKTVETEQLEFDEAYRLLKKLGSVESPEHDLLTVYSPGAVEEIQDLKGLKNAVTSEQLRQLRKTDSFAAFLDPDREAVVLKTRPFFSAEWELDTGFHVSQLLDFMGSEKTWVLVSAGETRIYREQSGEYRELETVKTRVDRKHSKGGFSQDRFERKREEQVEQHLEEVREVLGDYENVYLLGQKQLCRELPGEHLGGFDPNRSKPEVFYSFQRLDFP